MVALHEKFGKPHQLFLRNTASVLEAPDVKHGDTVAFEKFVHSLVGLLKTTVPAVDIDLNCESRVARGARGVLPSHDPATMNCTHFI